MPLKVINDGEVTALAAVQKIKVRALCLCAREEEDQTRRALNGAVH